MCFFESVLSDYLMLFLYWVARSNVDDAKHEVGYYSPSDAFLHLDDDKWVRKIAQTISKSWMHAFGHDFTPAPIVVDKRAMMNTTFLLYHRLTVVTKTPLIENKTVGNSLHAPYVMRSTSQPFVCGNHSQLPAFANLNGESSRISSNVQRDYILYIFRLTQYHLILNNNK